MSSFSSDLEFSHQQARMWWWREVYEQAFGRPVEMEYLADGSMQKHGVDRKVLTLDGRTLDIDEKVRRSPPGKWSGRLPFPDVTLEIYSNYERRTPGWAAKFQHCDYVAYAVPADRTCILLDHAKVYAAWQEHGPQWIVQWGLVPTTTRVAGSTYTTRFCPVELPTLIQCCDAMEIQW